MYKRKAYTKHYFCFVMVTVTKFCVYTLTKWRGHLATHISAYKNCISITITEKWEAMDTTAPTYSYPHVRNKTLTCHIMLSALGKHCRVQWPRAPPHFIVNLDLTLISKFERVRQIKICKRGRGKGKIRLVTFLFQCGMQ